MISRAAARFITSPLTIGCRHEFHVGIGEGFGRFPVLDGTRFSGRTTVFSIQPLSCPSLRAPSRNRGSQLRWKRRPRTGAGVALTLGMRQHISYSEGNTACGSPFPLSAAQTAAAASPTPLPVTGSRVIAGDEMSIDGHDDGKPDNIRQHRREFT